MTENDQTKPGESGEEQQSPEATDAASQPEIEVVSDDAEGGDEITPEAMLEAAKAEAKENYDNYLRAQAELQNVMRRHQRDLSDRAKYEGAALCKDLLDVVDNLERALDHAAADDGLAEGVKMVHSDFLAALEKHGVEKIDAVGATFDPAEHEAVAMVESADAAANTVIECHRSGFKLRDRLLRAAMVVVSKGEPGQG